VPARKKFDGCPTGTRSAGKPVRRTAEVVDKGVIPVAHEFADHPDTSATNVDAVIETLRNGCSRVGVIVVTATVEVHPAGNRNAILIIRCADRWPVVRHLHDRVKRRNRALDWIGCIGRGNAGLGIRFRIGGCCSGGIGLVCL
jgi:hypothetical protein